MSFDPREFDGATDESEGQQDLTVGTQVVGTGSETAEESEELSSADAQQIATALVAPPAAKEEEVVDTTYLADVDKRLEVAHYYRMLTKGAIFEDQNEATAIVEKELRIFIRERLSVLLNLKGEGEAGAPKQGQFTEEEVAILKVWARALKNRPSVVESVSQQPATKRPPVVRRQQTGGGVRTIGSSRPASPPPAAPATTPPAAPATKPVAAAPAPAAKPVQPTTPAPGGGPPPAPGTAPGRRLRRAIMKQLTTADGVPVFDKATGKPVLKNVTPQVRLASAIPLPSVHAMPAATATASQRGFVESDGASLGTAIAGGQIPVGQNTSGEEE